MHSPLHAANPFLHVKPQPDASQVGVPFTGRVHDTPHAAQFSGSDVVSTQRPEQSVCPGPHEVRHFPSLQTSLLPHTVPHAPQWFGSERKSIHWSPHFS